MITDNLLQWLALGIGIYVVFSWAQSLKARDSATYHMIFKSKAMVFTMIAFPTISCDLRGGILDGTAFIAFTRR